MGQFNSGTEQTFSQSEKIRIAHENFNEWNKALLSCKAQQVANLYLEEATFLPTLSSDFKKGIAGAKDYFGHFLLQFPEGKIMEDAVQSFGEECIVHSGMYYFTVGKERNIVKARFTFVWQKTNGQWKIAHHHSSLVP